MSTRSAHANVLTSLNYDVVDCECSGVVDLSSLIVSAAAQVGVAQVAAARAVPLAPLHLLPLPRRGQPRCLPAGDGACPDLEVGLAEEEADEKVVEAEQAGAERQAAAAAASAASHPRGRARFTWGG